MNREINGIMKNLISYILLIKQYINKYKRCVVKTFSFLVVSIVLLFGAILSCDAQVDAKTPYEVGVINPVEGKTYLFFKDIKTDTSVASVLTDNVDYLTPVNLSAYIQELVNYKTVGDTLFGYFVMSDTEAQEYIKAGLVQKDITNNKYSGMTVTGWMSMNVLEKRPAFFIRKQ